MNDNLKQLAGLLKVLGGLQQTSGLGDISKLAQLDLADREMRNKQTYYDQNQQLEREKFDRLLQQQQTQNSFTERELGLRQSAEQRQLEAIRQAQQNWQAGFGLRQQDAAVRQAYMKQLMEASGATVDQKRAQMEAMQQLLGGGSTAPNQPTAPQLGPAEMQFIQQMMQQFKQPTPQ